MMKLHAYNKNLFRSSLPAKDCRGFYNTYYLTFTGLPK